VIVDAVRVALERTPPELSADIVDRWHRADRRRLDVEESSTSGCARKPGCRWRWPRIRCRRLCSALARCSRISIPAAKNIDRLIAIRRLAVQRHRNCNALLDIRQRSGWLFMAVVVGHILLISTQVSTRRGVPVLESLTFGVFAEVQRGATSGIGSVRDVVAELLRVAGDASGKPEPSHPRSRSCASALQQERALAEQSRMLQKLLDMRRKRR
jgi:hypothetical protein